MATFNIGDFQMNYEKAPFELSNDCFFIHGNLANLGWWKPTFDVLSSDNTKSGGKVFATDWRGCGKSSATQSHDELKMPRLAQDHLELMNELGLEKVDIVGHSTGGLIALHMMDIAPERVGQVLFLDSVGADGVQLEPEMLAAFDQMRTDRPTVEAVMATTIKDVDTKSDFFQNTVVDGAFNVAAPNWTGIPKALTEVKLSGKLGNFQHSCLVLHGSEDTVLDINESRKLAEGLPNGRFIELENHGHSMNVEDPKKMAGYILEFLG